MNKKEGVGLLGKLILWLNSIVALLLLVSFLLPYIPPKSFPMLSVLNLAVSPLILINIIFVFYWLLRRKRAFIISAIILVIAYFHFHSFYKMSSEGDGSTFQTELKLLSYNVRLFNAYEESASEGVAERIKEILQNEQPDIIGVQEYYLNSDPYFKDYKYDFIHFQKKLNGRGKEVPNNLGHAIFSKYPILNSGGLDFIGSTNNAIWADIKIGEDTLRIYNMHLQSLGIKPSVSTLQKGDKKKLYSRLTQTFKKQQEQVALITNHKNNSPYPVILLGDLNNTPFSYVYKELQEGMNDAFQERGNGLGTTYKFDSYPMRIDYIFSDPKFEVINFDTLEESFSDHYPIVAKLAWD